MNNWALVQELLPYQNRRECFADSDDGFKLFCVVQNLIEHMEQCEKALDASIEIGFEP